MTIQELENKYPEIFENCFDFSVPEHWLPAIDKLCAILTEYAKRKDLDVMRLSQIKVKFGQARIYPELWRGKTEQNWITACENSLNKLK